MSSVWKIGTTSQSYGDASTFAAAGLENLQRDLVATGTDTVSFEVTSSQALTADMAFAFGSSYIVWKDGVRWFYGRVVSMPRTGSPKHESGRVVLAGPWWYLQNATYMQAWRVYDVNGEVLTNVNKCRVVLFQDSAGNRCGSGAQAGDVIDWLISRGAPISKGTIDAGITLPFDERTNLSCSDVMDTIIRWTPDFVGWFDYSTAPYPTFHFRARSNLSAASIALSGERISDLDITARYDLQKPGVHLTYEKTHSVDNFNYNTVETDVAGNASAIDCVYGVFDLQGSSRTYIKQKIVTEVYPSANNKAWWKSHVSWLAGIADADIDIHDHAVDTEISAYSRILTEGMVQDWMFKDAVQGCIRAQADVVVRDSSNNEVENKKNVKIVAQVTATDAATHTYMRLTSFDSGEATPTGVAAALYNAWSILHFEGSLSRNEDECSGTILPGKKLRISGGRSEWSNMDALVQQTTEQVDSGITTVQFGPPGRIEADSLVALFRAFRSRRFAWQAASRTTGSASGSGEVEMSGRATDSSHSSGGGETQHIVVSDTNDEGSHKIDNDPAAVTHEDPADEAGRTLKPTEIYVPYANWVDEEPYLVMARQQIMASPVYHIAGADPVGNFIRLSELHDVYIDSETLADGHGIRWNEAFGAWENGPVASAAENPGANTVQLGPGGVEGSEAALEDTWQSSNAEGDGLELGIVARVVYDETGDKIIYAFLRNMTFDQFGLLYSVGAETRVTVDVGESA